ncbi:MAG TPA: hypothetical protein VIN08_04265 [Ohtaekwangia sp.]|uniref:hypothetical protein n=1 Tax=Ohtaekwangia sp. TaxID=2066019 RepID=UPI002F9249DA
MNSNKSASRFVIVNAPKVEVAVQDYRLLDAAKFNRLTGGSDHIKAELLKAFVEFTPPLLGELQNVVAIHDAFRTERLLHKLKSSTSLLCVDSLYAEIVSLEDASATQINTTEFMDRIGMLIVSHETLMEEARAMLHVIP